MRGRKQGVVENVFEIEFIYKYTNLDLTNISLKVSLYFSAC